jgi:allantoin racemase
MKIVYFANSNLRGNAQGQQELEKREKRLRSLVSEGVDIRIVDNPEGPLCIETAKDEIQALPGTAKNLLAAQDQGVNAGVLGCAGDPGFHSLRELVTFPLIGPGHTSIFMAAMMGNRFSIFTPVESTIAPTRKLVEDTGLIGQLGSIRPMSIPVLEIRTNREATFVKLVDLGQRMVAEDDADTLIFCCMSIAFQGLADELSKKLGVSVIDPVAVSVTLAESLARIGLTHSPRFYHRE